MWEFGGLSSDCSDSDPGFEIPPDFLEQRDDTVPQEREGLGSVADGTERSG